MKQFILLITLLTAGFALQVDAQCIKLMPEKPTFFDEYPSAKVAVIASADESIEARIDPKTGNTYYVRVYTNNWTGGIGYHVLEFDPNLEQFIEQQEFYAWQGGEVDALVPCRQQPDSSQNVAPRPLLPHHPKLIPLDVPTNKQPRRSSRVKLASVI